MTGAPIRASGLCKVFPAPAGGEHVVLDHLDLAVGAGEFVCILGPTGCGKTTLLRLLTGLDSPTAGEAHIDSLQRGSGMVFQQNSLLPWKRVLANVALPLELAGVPRREARARAGALLGRVDLDGVGRAYPYELSGGMQQRAAIARALATGGETLLLDEPFGALDDQTRIKLQAVLLDVWRETGATVLFVTHNIEEALVLGDRLLVLGGGRILADETVELTRPRDRFAPDFVDAFVRLRRTFAEAVSSAGPPPERPAESESEASERPPGPGSCCSPPGLP